MRTLVEMVEGPNRWAENRTAETGKAHACYFCTPDYYDPMPQFHTLCVRCGHLIRTPGVHDPMNGSMFVCPGCEADLALDEMS